MKLCRRPQRGRPAARALVRHHLERLAVRHRDARAQGASPSSPLLLQDRERKLTSRRRAQEIVYVDLEDGTIVRRFEGHDIGKFVVRACFGGASDNFILSGSADGKVYVYHRDTGRLLHALGGHERTTVNAVAWNAKAPGGVAMWASCSDDRTVRVWGMPPPPSAGEGAAAATRGPRLRPLDRTMRD